jgi:5-methylcytosine-specific restriction endonuclease McrA
MKRTPLKRRTSLKAHTQLRARKPINRISKKKRLEIQEEKPIRQQLNERAGGFCERCGRAPDFRGLHPHEKVFRSHGGKLTLANSEMWCGRCHAVDGHNLIEK